MARGGKRSGAGRPRKTVSPVEEGTDPFLAIDDTLGHILAELKKISAACEKAGGL